MMTVACRGFFGLDQSGWDWVRDDFTANWSRLYHYVLSKVRDPHVSEDIAQEAMTRVVAVQNGKTVDNPQALSFSIALNLVRDHFRRRRGTVPLDEALPSLQPLADDVVMHRQKLAMVIEVIEAMPPLRREVFKRSRVDGDSVAAIAASLNLSHAAVEKHLVRGLADLHRVLAKRLRAFGSKP